MREIKFKFLMEDGQVTNPYYLRELIDSDSYVNIECEYSSKIKQELQYTGLKDKNGVEIYEMDIVSHNGSIGYVKYINSGNCNVLGYALVSLINSRIFYVFCDEADNYEVIGNIYENKELLA